MRYDEFRDRWQKALRSAGLLSSLDGAEEAIDLRTTARRWEARQLPRSVEPFSVGALISFVWDPFESARSYTCEEDLLTNLVGRGARRTTQRRLLRVDITLGANLPYGSTAPMPASDVWIPWVASVEESLDAALTPRRRRGSTNHLYRGDLEIAGRSTLDEEFCFDRISVSAFDMIVVPRMWDDPDRREKERSADSRIDALAERFRAAADAWTARIGELVAWLRYTPGEGGDPSPRRGGRSRRHGGGGGPETTH